MELNIKLLIGLLTIVLAGSAVSSHASESFWQSPDTQATQYSAEFSETASHFSSSHNVDLYGKKGTQQSLAYSQQFNGDNTLSFEYADGRVRDLEQKNVTLGYTHKDLSLSMMSGYGEDLASLTGDYAGVDPYLFHGGAKQRFDVRGYAVDYRFGRFGHMQYGEASVKADGFEDRTARYLEWSRNSMFAKATRFARGGEDIGNGLELGFARGNKILAVQAMQLDNDRKMQRIRLHMNGKHSKQYWVDLSAHQNALYRDNDDVRIMFNFKTLFGAKQLASYQNEGGNSDQEAAEGEDGTTTKKKKGKAWKRGLYIGAGIAAAAALSSSGSSSQDETTRFRTQLDAAFNVLNGINPTSVRENREYGGWVFVNQDGSYASTTPVKGEAASVTLPRRSVVIPVGSRATATYHTHAAFDPRYDNENFSPTDLASDRQAGTDGYLATPGGQFKYHNVATGAITTVGTVATTD